MSILLFAGGQTVDDQLTELLLGVLVVFIGFAMLFVTFVLLCIWIGSLITAARMGNRPEDMKNANISTQEHTAACLQADLALERARRYSRHLLIAFLICLFLTIPPMAFTILKYFEIAITPAAH